MARKCGKRKKKAKKKKTKRKTKKKKTKRKKRYYKITPSGRRLLKIWIERIKERKQALEKFITLYKGGKL